MNSSNSKLLSWFEPPTFSDSDPRMWDKKQNSARNNWSAVNIKNFLADSEKSSELLLTFHDWKFDDLTEI